MCTSILELNVKAQETGMFWYSDGVTLHLLKQSGVYYNSVWGVTVLVTMQVVFLLAGFIMRRRHQQLAFSELVDLQSHQTDLCGRKYNFFVLREAHQTRTASFKHSRVIRTCWVFFLLLFFITTYTLAWRSAGLPSDFFVLFSERCSMELIGYSCVP